MTTHAIAFDIYGTLIDTQGVVQALSELVGDRADTISRQWRQKQLEYSFRRGLMRDYQDFAVCTAEALAYTCLANGVTLSPEMQAKLMRVYEELPPFADAEAGLSELRESGFALYAFSNGSRRAVERLLTPVGLRGFFEDVVSVEEVRSFKPSPEVYSHLVKRCALPNDQVWLVSSNPFDILGAAHSGLRTAWLQRDPSVIFDPWGVEPTLTVHTLKGLASTLS